MSIENSSTDSQQFFYVVDRYNSHADYNQHNLITKADATLKSGQLIRSVANAKQSRFLFLNTKGDIYIRDNPINMFIQST